MTQPGDRRADQPPSRVLFVSMIGAILTAASLVLAAVRF